MTDEERQRTMDFILQQMAQAAAAAQRNEEEHAKFTKSLKQVRRILAGAILESRRHRRAFDERMAALANARVKSDEAQSRLDEKMNALVDAQIRTEEAMRSREDAMRSLQEAMRSLAATTERNSMDIAALARAGKPDGKAGGEGGDTPS